MKRILFLFLYSIIYSVGLAQNYSQSVLNKDWNWENNNPNTPEYQNTWWFRVPTQGTSNTLDYFGSPFIDGDNPRLKEINYLQDYTYSKGWRLLQKNLAETTNLKKFPYFVLYNVNTGVVRLYLHPKTPEGTSFKRMMVTFSITDKESGSISSNGEGFSYTPDFMLTGSNSLSNNYKVSNTQITSSVGDGAWLVLDYTILFNPYNNNPTFDGTRMSFEAWGLSEQSISLEGGSLSVTDAAANTSLSFPGSADELIALCKDYGAVDPNATKDNFTADFSKLSLEDIYKNRKKYISTLNDVYEKGVGVVDAINESGQKLEELYPRLGVVGDKLRSQVNLSKYALKTNGSGKFMENLGKVSSVIGIVGGYIGAAQTAISLFGELKGMFGDGSSTSDASTPVYTPTITKTWIKLKGTISSTTAHETFGFILPSAAASGYDANFLNANQAYYNCPLGIFNIKNQPVCDITNTEKFQGRFSYGIGNSTYFNDSKTVYPRDEPKTTEELIESVSYTWLNGYIFFPIPGNTCHLKKYTITNTLIPVVNDNSGYELVDAQAAFVFETTADQCIDYFSPSEFKTYDGSYTYWNLGNRTVTKKYTWQKVNLFYEQMLKNKLIFAQVDPNNQRHTLQTPYVKISCFNNVSIVAEDFNNVRIRVVAILKKKGVPNNQATPLFFSNDYVIQAGNVINATDLGWQTLLYDNATNTNPDPSGYQFENVKNLTINQCVPSVPGTNTVYAPQVSVKLVTGACAKPATNSCIKFTTSGYDILTKSFCPNNVNTQYTTLPCLLTSNTYRMGDVQETAEISSNESSMVHPNPISGGNIYFGKTASNYKMLNAKGEEVQKGNDTNHANVDGLSKGLYLLILDGKSQKIIVQ